MRQRITGDARENLRQEMKQGYESSRKTVRQLAEEYGVSYGRAHTLLREAGTEFRSRGGKHAR
jgi:transposase